MFAVRDQENIVPSQQALAGAKAASNGIKALHPKTPAVRPAATPAPRTRAPLGAKTSNVKATAFKTPAPLTGGAGLQKTTRRSASARKPKLKIQADAVQAAPVTKEVEEEEPDVEYCPPKITDDDLYPAGADTTIRNINTNKTTFDDHLDQVGPDGLTRYDRENKQSAEWATAYEDRVLLESAVATLRPQDKTAPLVELTAKTAAHEDALHSNLGSVPDTDPKKAQPRPVPSTMTASSAAAALAKSPRPRFAAPTRATQAKQAARDPVKHAPLPAKGTVGYAQGRRVASMVNQRQPRAPASPSKANKADNFGVDSLEQQEILRRLTERADAGEDTDAPLFAENEGFEDWFHEHMAKFRLSPPDGEPEQ